MTTNQIIAIADRVIPQWRDTHRFDTNVYARAALIEVLRDKGMTLTALAKLMSMKNHQSIMHLLSVYPNKTNPMAMEVRQTLLDAILVNSSTTDNK